MVGTVNLFDRGLCILFCRNSNLSFSQSERDSEEEILKVFELFDEEGTGFITFKSLKRVCEELNESLYGEFIGDSGRICDLVSLHRHILAAHSPLLFFFPTF
jgi:hypothetical protein